MPIRDIRSGRHNPTLLSLPADREAEAVLRIPGSWPAGIQPHIPTKTVDASLPAKVNHGRWVVDCPCGSAQLASRTDRRFYCVECGNALFSGQWVRVEWPSDKQVEQIEQALLTRPSPTNQNWTPGETVGALTAENASRLVDKKVRA